MIRLVLIAPTAIIGLLFIMIVFMSPPSNLSAASGTDAEGAPTTVEGIPADYLALYWKAGQEYGIDWAVLAAIGSIESNHGQSTAAGVSSGQNFLGCCAGPMQFLNNPAFAGGGETTWEANGVDGDGDGDRDIYDPVDAIPSAANYLRRNVKASERSDAAGKLRDAIFRYNNSDAYVADVLARATAYRESAVFGASPISGEFRATGKLVPVASDVANRKGLLIDSGIADEAAEMARQHDMVIVSGHRSRAHNTNVGGARRSDHLCGLGVDFANGSVAEMRAMEHWAKEQNIFAHVLGPDSDPRGHHDHVHISFLRCGGSASPAEN